MNTLDAQRFMYTHGDEEKMSESASTSGTPWKITINRMTPTESKDGGKNLHISYSFGNTRFGPVVIASTTKGVCFLGFADNREQAKTALKTRFPGASFREHSDEFQQSALGALQPTTLKVPHPRLHVKATEFQLEVWQRLLEIPIGQVTTYGAIAKQLGNDNASRAVGAAVGSNPVACLIPCHRVVQSSGELGGYMWGVDRKSEILQWEKNQTGHAIEPSQDTPAVGG